MPSPEEWTRHKNHILDLYNTHPLAYVIKSMTNEHGFQAADWQYEEQFRAWNVRKNLKKEDWPAVVAAYDRLVSCVGAERVRLLIGGTPVAKDKINRNRRRYRNSRQEGAVGIGAPLPRAVALQVLTADGSWHAPDSTTAVMDEELRETNTENLQLEQALQNSAVGETVEEFPCPQNGFVDFSANSVLGPIPCSPHDFSTSLSYYSPQWFLDAHTEGLRDYFTVAQSGCINDARTSWSMDPQARSFCDAVADICAHLPLGGQEHSLTPGNTVSLARRYDFRTILRRLPYVMTEMAMALKGFELSSLTTDESPREQCIVPVRSFSQFLWNVTLSGWSTKRSMWLDDIPLVNHHNQRMLLQPLFSLLPGEPFILDKDDARLDKLLPRLLLFSFANNFPGLDQINIASVLGFLGRYKDMGLLVSKLEDFPSAYRKALAVGLFRASLEADEAPLARQVLRLGLFDVDSVTCSRRSSLSNASEMGYSALEVACLSKSLKMVQTILQAGADPNKGIAYIGAIEAIVHRVNWGSHRTASEIKDELIRNGAHVNISLILKLIMDSILSASSVAYDLILGEAHKRHQDFGVADIQRLLARSESGYQQSHSILQAIIQTCNETHGGLCLDSYPSRLRNSISNRDFGLKGDGLLRVFESGNSATIRTYLERGAFGMPSISEQRSLVEIALEKATTTGHETTAALLLDALPLFHSDGIALGALLSKAAERRGVSLVSVLQDWGIGGLGGHMLKDFLLPSLISWGDKDLILIAQRYFPLSLSRDALKRSETERFIRPRTLRRVLFEASLRASLDVSLLECDKGLLQFLVAQKVVGKRALSLGLTEAIWRGDRTRAQNMLELGAKVTIDGLQFAANIDSAWLFDLFPRQSTQFSGSTLEPSEQLRLLKELIGNTKSPSSLSTFISLISSGLVHVPKDLYCTAYIEAAEPGVLMTPLGYALGEGSKDPNRAVALVKILLEGGSHPNQIVREDEEGNHTPLLLAIGQRNMPLIELLLSKGANAHEAADYNIRRTPLQKAAEVGDLEIVNLLLNLGAKVSAAPAPWGGGTALQLAAISGNCNIAIRLMEEGANIDQAPSRYHGRWPLEGAAEHGRMDMTSLLWEASGGKAERSICDRAMKFAVEKGHEACKDLIEELMERDGITEK